NALLKTPSHNITHKHASTKKISTNTAQRPNQRSITNMAPSSTAKSVRNVPVVDPNTSLLSSTITNHEIFATEKAVTDSSMKLMLLETRLLQWQYCNAILKNCIAQQQQEAEVSLS